MCCFFFFKYFIQILYRVRWPDTWESEENVLDTYALECFLNNIDVTEHRLCTVEAEDDEELWDAHQIIKRKIVNKKVNIVHRSFTLKYIRLHHSDHKTQKNINE